MLLNQKHNILFVAVPKTATTAVQDWLLHENLGFKKGDQHINGRTIKLREHYTALKARELLGKDFYDMLNVIAFIRHPYSRLISAYNFYRGGGKAKSIVSKTTKNKTKRILHSMQYVIAKLLPFSIWALVYPYRDNRRYCVDENENLIISHIGIYENLVRDMKVFLRDIKLNADISNLSYLNKSRPKASDEIIKNKFFQKLLLIRHKNLKEDLKFYNHILSIQDSHRE